MVRMNRSERKVPFLSNLVKGTVHADTPDGCNYDTDLTPYQGMVGMPQPGSDLPEPRVYGGRSGIGKKTSVE
jgi:hypothetical protein